MSAWKKWKNRPQSLWLRKALFQVHLWTGIGFGLYILMMSVTGSALIFRRDLSRTLSREPRVTPVQGARLTAGELREAAKRAYPGYQVSHVYERTRPDLAAEIWLERGSSKIQRLFNPYTGADVGPARRLGFRMILWLADLHDNLLIGTTGRWINAIGGIISLLLCFTGAVIWWPGIAKWRGSLVFHWKGNRRGFNWALHSALGFWSLALILLWSVSGIYLSIPTVFSSVVDFLEPLHKAARNPRLGDQVLYWLTQLHFGRFAGPTVKTIWTVTGLAPAVLFFTGLVMWWNRVLKPRLGRMAPVQERNHARLDAGLDSGDDTQNAESNAAQPRGSIPAQP